MTEQPLVCICIPTYNAADTVGEMLSSILSQTYRNIVVHISDNASSDDTVKIVQNLADHRVHIHKQKINVEAEENFSKCIGLAEGKYTAIFHADDFYEPQMVEKQVAFLESNPEAGAVFTAASIIDETGKKLGEMNFPVGLGSLDRPHHFETIFKAILCHSNFLICPSVMARTQVYQQDIQSWRGSLFKSSADLDVWLRIARKYPIGLLPVALMRYRISANQGSAKVRLQTTRHDFFLVAEHYLALDDVRRMLSRTDLENYARLNRRDRVMRAVNCLLSSKSLEAHNLLKDIYSWQAWKAALQTKRGFGVLIAGIYLRLLLLFRMEKIGQFTLGYLKRAMRR
jgi:glycosyltransferase involved in cell wall biosynthesis